MTMQAKFVSQGKGLNVIWSLTKSTPFGPGIDRDDLASMPDHRFLNLTELQEFQRQQFHDINSGKIHKIYPLQPDLAAEASDSNTMIGTKPDLMGYQIVYRAGRRAEGWNYYVDWFKVIANVPKLPKMVDIVDRLLAMSKYRVNTCGFLPSINSGQ